MIRPVFDKLTPDQRVSVAQRIQAFVNEPAVKEMFAMLREDAYQNFLTGVDVAAREMAHAEAVVLDRFFRELRVIANPGTQARPKML
jgi:hypothetical protein